MAAGAGALDTNGIWQFGESDTGGTGQLSDILNLLAKSVSDKFASFNAPTDLGWSTAISAYSGRTTLSPSGSIPAVRLRREGKRVKVFGGMASSSSLAAFVQIGSITDATLRPPTEVGGVLHLSNGGDVSVVISAAGAINIWEAWPSGVAGFFNFDYYVD